MFSADLMEVLRRLRQMSGQWLVHIEPIENDAPSSSSPWLALLAIVAGQITSCRIYNRTDGRLILIDQDAIQQLATLRRFSWRLEPMGLPQLPSPDASRSHSTQTPQIPRRAIPIEKGVIETWSRKQRQVYGLIDSSRTIEQIARLLRQPPEVVEQILDELRVMGVLQR